ncbi:ANTAR domain-containing protein [Streptomyces umbrinus]|uniref:ANTAR domain-containing protein n=1 Tax=Streptomyces umbrinus TaxID=67370 RepID=UPI0033F2A361
MHQVTMHSEVPPLLTAGTSTGDGAMVAELLELRASNEQLSQALVSRPVIDQARGMAMVLAPCSGDRSWDLLVDVSQHSSVKLRDVAAALVATTKGQELPALRREWRRALRRLHAQERP